MLEIYVSNELIDFFESLSNQPSWYEAPAVVAIISGGGAVLAALATYIFNYFSDRRRERHKERVLDAEFRNKKLERIHDQKIVALKEFVELKESMLPSIWDSPFDDAGMFYEQFLLWDAKNYFVKLDSFMKAWLYILSEGVSNKLSKIKYIFNTFDYEMIEQSLPDYSPSAGEIFNIETIFKELDEALKLFKQELGIVNKN